MVYINSLKKWVWMDPQENAYLMDEKGLLLNIQELRERLIAGKKFIINPEANYHNVRTTKDQYINDFMLEFMYRFTCPVTTEYNSQTRTAGKILRHGEILPAGNKIPPSDNF